MELSFPFYVVVMSFITMLPCIVYRWTRKHPNLEIFLCSICTFLALQALYEESFLGVVTFEGDPVYIKSVASIATFGSVIVNLAVFFIMPRFQIKKALHNPIRSMPQNKGWGYQHTTLIAFSASITTDEQTVSGDFHPPSGGGGHRFFKQLQGHGKKR
ncbi:hypothetical protein CS022_24080 [Veronia nyctiphanis]|uniref:Uncharacterized protein n=1 Tax=Veronia nyctiphanis TaxID=1278244 RepID=A0A4V1LRM4_9GAMM|nr:hypothetical protein [Veronia nyctiphanis]RXJ68708.1 hypothetical protein CS022_24080 [Veronia nyctiphanis]